ncbi:MAG: 5-(carboxyamino)imidazole ribonucleotide synthase [Bacteroidetes bacterium]|nr:5-(carboxyamino)imidazole ribonucleotide synthase [Bacteroidota bacterium]
MFNPSQKKIGILGGGQLGRMLIQSGIDFNLSIHVLDPDKQAPCKHIAKEFTQGSLTDFDAVYSFGKKLDIITIEIENVHTGALKKLEQEGKEVYPQPHIIETIQDKGLQKLFFQRNNIPTPDFFLIENKEQIHKYQDFFPFFQKLRKGGYDGKGVTKLSDAQHLEQAFDAPSVLERLVDFKTELSVVVSRNKKGEVKTFPAVACAFNPEANLVEFLFAPAPIPKKVEQKAQQLAIEIAEKLGIIGILAVELFVTKNNEVLVNELAPRPHNSGHHSIEANNTSQFEQHLRAILNLPLGDTALTSPAVMINLLGEKGYEGKAVYQGIEEVMKLSGTHIHLYGKETTKPFRKMGHVTLTATSLQEAEDKARKVKAALKVISE